MKLFGFIKKSKGVTFPITELDREWIEDNFKWLIQVYGFPTRENEQVQISPKHFPETFKRKAIKVESIIDDLSQLLELDRKKISFKLYEDLRDVYGMPYETEGKPFEAETEVLENHYTIHIANSLTKHPKRLTFSLIYEAVKIRLTESKLQYDTGEDTSLFIYLAGIYFGFGVILSQNLIDRGRSSDGFWETKWNYVSEMPNEVMAFALATYSKLIGQERPIWKNELPQALNLLVEKAIDFLKEAPSAVFSQAELDAHDLFEQADQEYQDQNFEAAISTLQKILFLTNDELLKCDVYNNIGYYQTRIGEFEKSILNFRKALGIDPDYGFACDNLGFALIKIGQLEEGRKYLEQALQMENNDPAYTYRNFALYYRSKGEFDKAEEHFNLAIGAMTIPVDLLELHYADFLLNNGEHGKGMRLLNTAVEKGEPEAIKRMNEIRKN